MTLSQIVASRDWRAMQAYIADRYDIVVTEDHAALVLFDTARYFMGREGMDIKLKSTLTELGYLTPWFTSKEDEPKVTWNELHLFTSEPYTPDPDSLDLGSDLDPHYVRSKIGSTIALFRPINKTAHSVAPPPT